MQQGDLDRAARRAVLHGVVRQVVDNLMDLIPGGQHRAGPLRPVGQLRALLLSHQAHHPHHLLQHRQHVHHRRRLHHPAVQPGQSQQVLGDAGEALRLRPDVRDELPGGLRVDVLRLEDGVRQQPDGRQRRLQLVGGVGNKPAAGVLRGLEAVRQAVELLRQLGDLVVATDLGPMTVGPLPHLPDGGEQLADLPGQSPGQQAAEAEGRHPQAGGQAQQIALEPLQQGGLLRVVLIGVHGADDLVLIQHRRGGPAAEGPVPVAAGGHVVAQQGLDDLCVKAVLPQGVVGLPGVVEDLAGTVRHQDAAEARLLHHRHGLGHVLLIEPVQARQGVDHHRHAVLQGCGLGPEHQVLGHPEGICVHQDQRRRHDQEIAEAEFGLEAAPESALTL